MKRFSLMQASVLFAGVLFMFASLVQCRKTGDLIKNLDRSYTAGADSTVFASFSDNTTIATADVVPDVNDIIKVRGVQTIIHEYCNTGNCHGGRVKPTFDTYADIMKYVSAGNPGGSKLWEYITTNNFDKAMPPVNSNHELPTTDKKLIYNWILNGAKQTPDLADFRPAAIRIINDGCGSANCHNQATATGGWARKGLLSITSADTTMYTYTNPSTGAQSLYCLLTNTTIRDQVWNAYKDSVKKFYSDTVAFASFRPYKTVSTPVSASSTRGPLQTYDDILMDINYPKGLRANSSVVYTDPVTLKGYYVRGNNLNSSSVFISRVDSTLLPANPFTGVYNTTQQGGMAYDDGGLKPSEVALLKAWYFADPNVPTVWKYGINNAGILKYRKTGKIIKL
ncbi:MAG: hypothetical protein IPQ08_10195 [Chitinophagaceae bacterium]|jgi:hypothetical protein|nr:hypothetical protein [Chitinophagaceae bacterium]